MSFDLGSVVAHIKADVSDFQEKIKTAQGTMDDFAGNLRSAGTKLTAFATVPIVGLGVAAVKSAADQEQLQVAFGTMLGSAEKAKTLLGQLTEFAATTPFQLTEVQNAAKSLLAYGISADKVEGTLRAVGDVAAGTNTPIGEMATLFGKMKSQQVIFTEDLNQLTGRGIPILDILAEKYKTNVVGIREMASQGKLSFDDVEAAFTGMSGEGGKFFNLMDAQSKTTAGQFSNLQDSTSKLAMEIGQTLLPYATELVKKLMSLVEWFRGLDSNQKNVIIAIAGIIAVIGPLILIISGIITVVTTVIGIFTGLITVIGTVIAFITTLSLAPVILIAALVALIAAVVYFILRWTGLWDDAVAIFQAFVSKVTGFVKWLIDGMMSIFSSFYHWLVGGSLIPDLVNAVIGWIVHLKDMLLDLITGMWDKVKGLFEGALGFIKDLVGKITDAIMKPFNEAKRAVEDAINSIVNKMKDLNPLQRHSPSVVDLVTKGVDSLVSQYARLSDVGIPSAGASIPFAMGSMGAGQSVVVDMNGANITSPEVAEEYATMIGDKIINRLKQNLRI